MTQAIHNMKCGKAPGPDNSHPEFIKNLGPSGLKWLAAFFSTCMRLKNLLPKIWRKNNIIALLKPGKDAKVTKSYRPISLLCIPFKILEPVILSRITPYVEKCLPDFQAGFRARRSTINQVLQLCSIIEEASNLNRKLLLHSLTWQLPMTWDGTKAYGWNCFVEYPINIWWPSSWRPWATADLSSEEATDKKVAHDA